MADLKVDTAAILATAEKMEEINKKIKESFSNVNDAIKILDNAWEGSTATTCIAKLRKGNSDIMNARYDAFDNYISLLKKYVSPGYVDAEETNIKLADAFK